MQHITNEQACTLANSNSVIRHWLSKQEIVELELSEHSHGRQNATTTILHLTKAQ